MLRTALTALLVASGAGAALADEFFKTPSGNIGCAYDAVAGGRLVCLIYEPKVTAAILTEDGADASGPPETWDRSWVAEGVPVLAYGETKRVGAFTCASAMSGLTCQGRKHGFKLSRKEILSY